jgi:hypothetical protein
MTNVKLHINITQGIIDAEGDQDFVWRVYEDFRDRLGSIPNLSSTPVSEEEGRGEPPETASSSSPAEDTPKKRSSRRKLAPAQASGTANKEKVAGITGHKPRILNNLDTTGLKEFLSQYKLTNNINIIVVLTRFLETKTITPASLDAYFTCYRDAGLKLPEAFGQAFSDVRSKKGFIDFTGPDDITLTIRGTNHLDHGGIEKTAK